ncbi:4180_t:CDS:1 [Racocetra persica]|uniref:4180_t:CDS:1 n=1 Tax=Racocetra persica TaxID=160502 RepID=A0ACA9RMU1_9GLOM|nr:4180_t:CDS:1 [Racocetra persica]
MMQNSSSKKKSDGKKPMTCKNDKSKIFKAAVACDNCRKKRVRCVREGEGPCKKCINENRENECTIGLRLKRGPKKATGSSTGAPTNAEFQEWGKTLWESLGEDKQAVSDHLRDLPNRNSHFVTTNNKTSTNFGQNIQPDVVLGNTLSNEQSIFLSSLNQENLQDTSFVYNLFDNEQLDEILFEINPGQMFDLVQANQLNKNSDEQIPQENLNLNLFENNLEIDEQAIPEIRSPRSTSKQFPSHRSRSRDNRHSRQEARNHEHVSRSLSPNYRTPMHSNGGLTLNTIQYSPASYSPTHLSPIHYCTSNNSSASTSAHMQSPFHDFEKLSNQSSPLIPSHDFEDTNQSSFPINSINNLQLFNSDVDQLSLININLIADTQTSTLDDSEKMPFSNSPNWG